MLKISHIIVAILAFPLALAHPGETAEMVEHEMLMRGLQHARASIALAQCRDAPHAVEMRRQAAMRRADKADKLRAERKLLAERMSHQTRDLEDLATYVNKTHNQTYLGYDLNTPETTIFGAGSTCALVPETIIGPFWVTGEAIRKDITEGQAGIKMQLDVQFVNMHTCQPVPKLAVEAWQANSTGVYSGFPNGQDGINTTWLRGVQFSDDFGVATFDTIFPGHYDGRTNHIHLLAQTDYRVEANNTYTGGRALHIGQLYFEDALVKAVERSHPYNLSDIAITSWDKDGFMKDEATSQYDPFVQYVQLGKSVEDGLLAWIEVALDFNSDHTDATTPGAHYYSDGGHLADEGHGH
ncbi:hypothetical protein JX265_005744 [Neoarthrinium moseri]|uniref:Intradiol ring-cleavage dioxygenases domain-containing protein n=1 Tax=Neoarthrinium moseri TaxID=1658444 RepID=A0A9P9WND6_9PEZI|nr:hypothetical protein JX265_005744 [Neoarthrinium moseri]